MVFTFGAFSGGGGVEYKHGSNKDTYRETGVQHIVCISPSSVGTAFRQLQGTYTKNKGWLPDSQNSLVVVS